MIQIGEWYVVKSVFNQSGYDLEPGWRFQVVRKAGSQHSCEFDRRYLQYPFHDCTGDCPSGNGYFIYNHLIEEHCELEMLDLNPTWEL